MMRIQAVVALFPGLREVELLAWIEQRWVQPEHSLDEGQGPVFREIDVARVHMIYDLRHRLDVHEETMPLVLSLVDQMYELRRNLKAMTRALDQQPDDVRSAVLLALGDGSK
jgi:chaperone modulatory protein CbpM